MTTAEALQELAKAQAECRAIELLDIDQHRWAIGVAACNRFFGRFDCGCFDADCGTCEYEHYDTIEELIENQCLDRRADWGWIEADSPNL